MNISVFRPIYVAEAFSVFSESLLSPSSFPWTEHLLIFSVATAQLHCHCCGFDEVIRDLLVVRMIGLKQLFQWLHRIAGVRHTELCREHLKSIVQILACNAAIADHLCWIYVFETANVAVGHEDVLTWRQGHGFSACDDLNCAFARVIEIVDCEPIGEGHYESQ